MSDIYLHGLLEALAKSAEPFAKEIHNDLRWILVAVELSKERKTTGGLTRKAHQKVQQLRNPFFDTAHAPGAKQALNRVLRKTHKKMVDAITEAVRLTGVHQQAVLERSLHDDKPNIIAPSREGQPVEGWAPFDEMGIADDLDEAGTPLRREADETSNEAQFEELDAPDEDASGRSLNADETQQPGQWLAVIHPPDAPTPEQPQPDLFGSFRSSGSPSTGHNSKYEDYE